MRKMILVLSLLALGACTSGGPVKPNCNGTLRAVNPPVVAMERRP